MASVLVRAFDLETIPGKSTNITDYNEAFPVHAENIEILAQHGITDVSDGLFRPKEEVNRGQIAAFLDRALDVRNSLDAGLVEATAINNTTVDVTFDSEQTAADAEQFEIPGLEVLDANVVAGPEGENNVVRLVTSAQTEDEEYRIHYNGDRTSVTFTGAAADATSPVEVIL
ncbi:S-layer homology domain-containing protein [Geomicrobium sp. JCM 19055]|uniref:S-layer homology domain-containing protein n=1 Tax=Geomicrobium sp. JCM 19055 TaxID=1460649 RepID=UPI00045ECC4B|nr:S-layer homology domain-containing protein [Geomicrobium sp. JCM 19055]GAJ97356.1 hypothetical protein JCM19055_208 [Geomicrobium sp. JCM 19055]